MGDEMAAREREALRRLAYTQALLDAAVEAGRQRDSDGFETDRLDVEPMAPQPVAPEQLFPGVDLTRLQAAVAAGDAMPEFRHRRLTRPFARAAARAVVGVTRFVRARQTTVNEGVLSAIDGLAQSLARLSEALAATATRLNRVDDRASRNSAVLERRLQQGALEVTERILEQAVTRDELAVRLAATEAALARLDERTRILEQEIERLAAGRVSDERHS
jgi:hypothetical protein